MIKNMNKLSTSMAVALLFSTASFGMEQPGRENSLLLNLPTELQVAVLSHLDAKELSIVSEVNKEMNAVSNDAFLWKNLCAQKGVTILPHGETWKDHYIDMATTKTVRMTAYFNLMDLTRMSTIEVNFNGKAYWISGGEIDKKTGKLSIATDIKLSWAEVSKGLDIRYSIHSGFIYPVNKAGAIAMLYTDSACNVLAGTVKRDLFQEARDKYGNPLELVSIQLMLKNLKIGTMQYGYVAKQA